MAWGPGLLFMLGGGWVAYKLGDKVISSQIQSRQHQFEALREMGGHFAERFLTAQDAQVIGHLPAGYGGGERAERAA